MQVVAHIVLRAPNGRAGAWWTLVSRNRRILAASETYSSPAKCRKTAKLIAKAGGFRYVERNH